MNTAGEAPLLATPESCVLPEAPIMREFGCQAPRSGLLHPRTALTALTGAGEPSNLLRRTKETLFAA